VTSPHDTKATQFPRALALLGLLTAWASMAAAVEAQALVGSGTMLVGAAVNKPCILLTTAMTFPNYEPSAQVAADLYGTGFVSIGCSTSTVQVTISQGLYPDLAGGSTPANPLRRMESGGSYLNYDLCVDATCTTIWNDTPAGVPIDAPFPKNVPVYGRVLMNQSPPAGTYTDTVVITVSF